MEPSDIKSMDFDELRAELAALGEKEFRAAQIYEWLHKKLCGSFDEMTNISLALREKCKERFLINATEDGGSYGAMGVSSADICLGLRTGMLWKVCL